MRSSVPATIAAFLLTGLVFLRGDEPGFRERDLRPEVPPPSPFLGWDSSPLRIMMRRSRWDCFLRVSDGIGCYWDVLNSHIPTLPGRGAYLNLACDGCLLAVESPTLVDGLSTGPDDPRIVSADGRLVFYLIRGRRYPNDPSWAELHTALKEWIGNDRRWTSEVEAAFRVFHSATNEEYRLLAAPPVLNLDAIAMAEAAQAARDDDVPQLKRHLDEGLSSPRWKILPGGITLASHAAMAGATNALRFLLRSDTRSRKEDNFGLNEFNWVIRGVDPGMSKIIREEDLRKNPNPPVGKGKPMLPVKVRKKNAGRDSSGPTDGSALPPIPSNLQSSKSSTSEIVEMGFSEEETRNRGTPFSNTSGVLE